MLQLVFAYCETRNVKGEIEMAFGKDDGLPWKHISQDFKNFRNRTEGNTLIMGANTFMSLPHKLVNRQHIVTHGTNRALPLTKLAEQADQYILPQRLLKYIEMHPDQNYSVIGGSSMLQQFAPIADRLVVTKIIKKHYVPSTVKLPIEFIANLHCGFEMKETHFYKIDEVTDIMETVYVKLSDA